MAGAHTDTAAVGASATRYDSSHDSTSDSFCSDSEDGSAIGELHAAGIFLLGGHSDCLIDTDPGHIMTGSPPCTPPRPRDPGIGGAPPSPPRPKYKRAPSPEERPAYMFWRHASQTPNTFASRFSRHRFDATIPSSAGAAEPYTPPPGMAAPSLDVPASPFNSPPRGGRNADQKLSPSRGLAFDERTGRWRDHEQPLAPPALIPRAPPTTVSCFADPGADFASTHTPSRPRVNSIHNASLSRNRRSELTRNRGKEPQHALQGTREQQAKMMQTPEKNTAGSFNPRIVTRRTLFDTAHENGHAASRPLRRPRSSSLRYVLIGRPRPRLCEGTHTVMPSCSPNGVPM